MVIETRSPEETFQLGEELGRNGNGKGQFIFPEFVFLLFKVKPVQFFQFLKNLLRSNSSRQQSQIRHRRIFNDPLYLLFLHGASRKKSQHFGRYQKTVVMAVLFFRDPVQYAGIEKHTASGRQIAFLFPYFKMHGPFFDIYKLHFIMPVKDTETFVTGFTAFFSHIQHKKRKLCAVIGIMRINRPGRLLSVIHLIFLLEIIYSF